MIKTTPHITIKMFNLEPTDPFSIENIPQEPRLVFWLRLVEDCGWGESSTPLGGLFDHGEYIRYWHTAAQPGLPLPQNPEEISGWVNPDGPAAARCALDMALYDFIGRRQERPLYTLLELPKPAPQKTAITLCMDSPENMATSARNAAAYSIFKLRLTNAEDEKCLQAVREARPDACLRVDVRGKWSFEDACEKIDWLEKLQIELLEQPLAAEDIEGLGKLQKLTGIPIVADESVKHAESIERLAESGIRGVNLKLMKLGGITPAFTLARRAVECELSIMLSSSFESSLGTTALAHMSSMAAWLNLDTPLKLRNDPFRGIQYGPDGLATISDTPGIGVSLKE